MWGFVIPFLAFAGGCLALASAGYLVVLAVGRWRKQADLADSLDAKIRVYQQESALDDLRRHRDRINEDQDRFHRERDDPGPVV